MKRILIFALSLLIMAGSFPAASFAAAVDEATGKTNYAYGVTDITFSGYFSDAAGRKANLTDGEYTEDEFCGGQSTTMTLIIDLGEEKLINEVRLFHNTKGHHPQYDISLSTDGTSYSSVGTTGSYVNYCTSLLFDETNARYIKATTSGGDYGTQIAEIEVLGRTRTNIATGKSLSGRNGWYSSNNVHYNIVDGSFANNVGNATNATALTIDLGAYYEVEDFAVYETNSSKGSTYDVSLGYTTTAMTKIATTDPIETVKIEGVTLKKYACDFPKGTVTRYIKFTSSDSVKKYGAEVVVYGKEVEAPTMGNITETADSEAGTTTVKLDVINGGADSITGRVYAAIYDDNDMLSAVYKAADTVTVASGAYTTVDNIALNAASGNLKLFLWDDKLIPLCAAK